MRLIDYGAGEICDRISILSLKLLFVQEGSVAHPSFAIERDKLLVQLKTKQLNGRCQEAIFDLAAVNATLWHAEDNLRKLRLAPTCEPVQVSDLAFRIQFLNDRRASLVQQINRDSGDGDHREKVHG